MANMLSERVELLTRDQVAERLQVSPRTVDRYIASGQIPVVKVGERLIRIEPWALNAFVNRQRNR